MPQWERWYAADDIPWDHDDPAPSLIEAVLRLGGGGRALEFGCGTGAHAVWLARHGYTVTAIDLAPTAVERARARAVVFGVPVELKVADALEALPVEPGSIDLAVDRGVFHSVAPADRERFTARVAEALRPGGRWISLVGNADEATPDRGPPRLTATELAGAIEPRFVIDELVAVPLGPARAGDLLGWRVVARPR
ncbi:MAG: class I SAM-dependent methyltransferase [Myxococcota bacterium]